MARKPRRSTPAVGKADATIGNGEIYNRIRAILDAARMQAVQAVNSTQVVAYWLIGREIIEGELKGTRRAEYGQALVARLAERLTSVYGRGFTRSNIFMMRRFFELYPNLVDIKKVHALRGQSANTPFGAVELFQAAIQPTGASHSPGHLSPFLSWTHYRFLCRVEQAEARAFYEIECVANRWSTRELERQIASLLYERLTMTLSSATLCPRDRNESLPASIDWLLPSEQELAAEIARERALLEHARKLESES